MHVPLQHQPCPARAAANPPQQIVRGEVDQACHVIERAIYGASVIQEPISQREVAPRGDGLPLLGTEDMRARYVRQFISRARGPGAQRCPRLEGALKSMATVSDGLWILDKENFTKISLIEGLCRCYSECDHVFSHFAAGNVVRVADLMSAVRGNLEPHRRQMVREVWDNLDPQGVGKVKVGELLGAFDARQLPDVRFGRKDVEAAEQEFLEGLGVCASGPADRSRDFALEEAACRRRPRPTGSQHGGGPLQVPAGRPTNQPGCPRRFQADVELELNSRPPVIPLEAEVTWEQFQNYFTAVSTGIAQDEEFERAVRDAWKGIEAHVAAQTARLNFNVPKPLQPPCCMRLYATFNDGSQKMLQIDDRGLEEVTHAAGVGNGQIWTWGPEVKKELLRRFRANGLEGIQNIQLRM